MLQKRTESRLAVFDPRVALQNITATDSALYCSAVKRLGLYHRHFGAPVRVLSASMADSPRKIAYFGVELGE